MNKYLVLTIHKPSFQAAAGHEHHTFMDRLRAEGKVEMSGPFTDRSGGAYVLKANTLEEAKDIAFKDPFHMSNSSEVTVYEWDI
jgi:uncharacterized protein YciI